MFSSVRPFLLSVALSVRPPGSRKLLSGRVAALKELDSGSARHWHGAHPGTDSRSTRHFSDFADLEVFADPEATIEAPTGNAEGARVMQALHESGLDAALLVYTEAPRGSVLLSPVNTEFLMGRLEMPPDRSVCSSSSVVRCAKILREQFAAHLPRPRRDTPVFYPLLSAGMIVLAALASRIAIPDRRKHMDVILDRMQRLKPGRPGPDPEAHRLAVMLDLPFDPVSVGELHSVADACFRSSSHSDAVEALSGLDGLSAGPLYVAMEVLARMRFPDHPFMPLEDFLRVVELHETLNLQLTDDLFVSYMQGLSIAARLVCQPEEKRALAADHARITAILRDIHEASLAAERMLRAQRQSNPHSPTRDDKGDND